MGIRKFSDLEDMRDVQKILRLRPDLSNVRKHLDKISLEGLEQDMLDDIAWRAEHLGVKTDYWELVAPDIQRQLSSGSAMHQNYLEPEQALLQVEKQVITNVPFYRAAQIVRYSFRCFHRSDGKSQIPTSRRPIMHLTKTGRIPPYHGCKAWCRLPG